MDLQGLYLGDELATTLYHVHAENEAEAPAYVWDRAHARYVDRETGEALDPTEVRQGVESVIAGVQHELANLAEGAETGSASPKEWREQMEAQISVLHQAAALAATGGVQAQDVRKLVNIAERVQGELGYLDGFAESLARSQAGEERPYSKAEVAARASQYASAARPTYEAFRHQDISDDPAEAYDVGRRVLQPSADHCEECVALGVDPDDEGGYVPVEHIVPIGATPCRGRCECTIEYANSLELKPEQYTK